MTGMVEITELERLVKERLSKKRANHVFSVARQAGKMALRYGKHRKGGNCRTAP